ncbi:MAG: hypothetical protein WCH36_03735 [Chitinophagaceae bacterium]
MLFFPKFPFTIGSFQWEAPLVQLIKQLPVEEILLSPSAQSLKSLTPFVDQQLDHFFQHTIKEKLPMISMFIGEKTVGELKLVFMQELEQLFPTLLEKLTAQNVEELHQKMSHSLLKTLEIKMLIATRSIRWIALGWGIIWGLLTAFILTHL